MGIDAHQKYSGKIELALSDKTYRDQSYPQMQASMESMAERLRIAILRCPPLSLLSYLWSLAAADDLVHGHTANGEVSSLGGDIAFALEYLHAVLSSHVAIDVPATPSDADTLAQQVLELAHELRKLSTEYCDVASQQTTDQRFGKHTHTLSFHAMYSWVSIRGYRYQTVESEFFEFILAPHNEVLMQIYGVDATEIARGLQAAVLSPLVAALSPEDDARVREQNAESRNLIKTSGLPVKLLADLAFTRGSEREFFEEGALRGTPMKTLPGRVLPLVAIGDGYYACDPYFIRDSTYRAIERAIRQHLPSYRNEWKDKQTDLTEQAFQRIFHRQLRGAEMFRSVHYYNEVEDKWYENDVLILLDDVLLLVEVKAGVMVMNSPDSHFVQYANKITELVLKAYRQCARFLRYAASREFVSLCTLNAGVYQEVRRLRLADYRKILPIGLTLEAFTPISSYCKELDEILPILDRHPFISMSIDDLFVLSHFLPSGGELLHYLDVRQRLAGIKQVFLCDEVDHLGMYIKRNRFDVLAAYCIEQGSELLLFDKSSNHINRYFADSDWRSHPPPQQEYPPLLATLLQAIDTDRNPGFLRADSLLRDLGVQRREQLAAAIAEVLPYLAECEVRYIRFPLIKPVLVCVQRAEYVDFIGVNIAEAEAVALTAGATECEILVVHVRAGEIIGAWAGLVTAPQETDGRYVACMSRAMELHRIVTAYHRKFKM